jgi:hypothetical protein
LKPSLAPQAHTRDPSRLGAARPSGLRAAVAPPARRERASGPAPTPPPPPPPRQAALLRSAILGEAGGGGLLDGLRTVASQLGGLMATEEAIAEEVRGGQTKVQGGRVNVKRHMHARGSRGAAPPRFRARCGGAAAAGPAKGCRDLICRAGTRRAPILETPQEARAAEASASSDDGDDDGPAAAAKSRGARGGAAAAAAANGNGNGAHAAGGDDADDGDEDGGAWYEDGGEEGADEGPAEPTGLQDLESAVESLDGARAALNAAAEQLSAYAQARPPGRRKWGLTRARSLSNAHVLALTHTCKYS